MANSDHERQFRLAVSAGDTSAQLVGFDLRRVLMSSARLSEFDLSGVDLREADLSGAYFRAAKLKKTNLSRARAPYSDFRDADLREADLTSANLDGAVLTGADLSSANLSKARLVKARLNNVNLNGADLSGTDLRGAQGLTESQLQSALNVGNAILDERTLASTGRSGEAETARQGRRHPKKNKQQVDLRFKAPKPKFGDLFLVCGEEHSEFPPTGEFRFDQLADLGIEQIDDYFAICRNGDPVIWLFPMIQGRPVEHHSGPFDGIRLELANRAHKVLWSRCVDRFKQTLSDFLN